MNARLYDPVLGRFLSADTVIPEPGNMQAFNRYSYVDNNPLKYTDPSGHFKLGNLWKAVKPIVAIAAAAVIMAVTGNPMLAGFVSGFINTGSLEGAIIGGIAGAFFAGAGAIGEQFGTLAGIGANGVAGGLMSVAQGGKFGRGFLTAGLTKFAGGIGGGKFGFAGKGFASMFSRVGIAGAIGGVAARISGGRFWSGFQTGAFQRLFNDESHGDGYFARTMNSAKEFIGKAVSYIQNNVGVTASGKAIIGIGAGASVRVTSSSTKFSGSYETGLGISAGVVADVLVLGNGATEGVGFKASLILGAGPGGSLTVTFDPSSGNYNAIFGLGLVGGASFSVRPNYSRVANP